MAATGFTPISLYYSTTASAVPTAGNLANGELALNIADMKLYAKNSAGTVTLLASNATSATSGTSILYGNGSGGFSNVTIGSGISFAGGTLSATGTGGTVTSVSGTGTVSGITLSGTVTSSGSLTLGGSLSLVSPPPIGSSTPNTGAFTTLSATGSFSGVSISVTGVGGSADPYGTIAVSQAANANNYSYYGLTRNTSVGAGFGITGTTGALGLGANAFWFGSATSGSSGVMNSAWIAFSGSSFVTQGSITANTSLGVGTAASGTTGEIRATNAVTAYYSDDRLKTRFGNIANALEKVESLDGFYYEANETAQALGYIPKREVGVSAQSVQAVLPEVVVPAPIDDKYLTVHYDKLVPLLIEAIKELGSKVKTLENK